MREAIILIDNRRTVLIQALLDSQSGDAFPLQNLALEALDAGYTRERLVNFGVRTLKLERWQAEQLLGILVDGYYPVKLH